jgi:hypothetical protein
MHCTRTAGRAVLHFIALGAARRGNEASNSGIFNTHEHYQGKMPCCTKILRGHDSPLLGILVSILNWASHSEAYSPSTSGTWQGTQSWCGAVACMCEDIDEQKKCTSLTKQKCCCMVLNPFDLHSGQRTLVDLASRKTLRLPHYSTTALHILDPLQNKYCNSSWGTSSSADITSCATFCRAARTRDARRPNTSAKASAQRDTGAARTAGCASSHQQQPSVGSCAWALHKPHG